MSAGDGGNSQPSDIIGELLIRQGRGVGQGDRNRTYAEIGGQLYRPVVR